MQAYGLALESVIGMKSRACARKPVDHRAQKFERCHARAGVELPVIPCTINCAMKFPQLKDEPNKCQRPTLLKVGHCSSHEAPGHVAVAIRLATCFTPRPRLGLTFRHMRLTWQLKQCLPGRL